MQPSTPVKRVLTPQKTTDPLTPNKLQKFDSMTPDKNVTSKLLTGEDDDILLMADANGIEEGVTFDEAMSITEGEKNCNDNSKPDKADDNTSKQDRDDKTIKHTMNLKTNDKAGKDVQRETEFDWDLKANQKIQLPDTTYAVKGDKDVLVMTARDLNTDKTSDTVSNGDTVTELDGKTDQTSHIAEGDDAGILTAAAHQKNGHKVNDDALPFSAVHDIFKSYK